MRGVRWGAFESPNGSVTAYEAADARYGVTLELARTFWNLDANLPVIAALVAAGRTPIVSFDALHWRFPHMPKQQMLQEIGAGLHDDILLNLGKGLAAMEHPMFLTLAHEADMAVAHGEYMVADWPGAYRRFYKIIRPLSKDLRIGPIFTGWFNKSTYDQWVVPSQFIGVDPYCWPDHWQWPSEMLASAIPPIVAQWPRKHIFVCETGCDEDSRKPRWLSELPKALAAYPNIKGVSYFDVEKTESSGAHHNWRMDSSPASLAAARQMLSE